MKKLHLFILKSYLGPLILTFFITVIILQLQWLWKYIDDLAGKGLEFIVLAELMAYATTTLVPMALPLAILLASLMTFGNLGENYELVALKSAGISLFRSMMPLIILNGFMIIGAFYFSNNILPWANLKMTTLMYDVKNQSPELSIKEGAFFNDIEGYSIKVVEKNHKTGILKDVMVYDHTGKKGNIQVTVADSGLMHMTEDKRFLLMELWSGYSYAEMEEKKTRASNRSYPYRRDDFEEQKLIFSMEGSDMNRTDEGLFKKHYQMLNLGQLKEAQDSLSKVVASRKNSFGNNLLKSNYFKKTSKKQEIQERADSISMASVQSTDSIFSNLTLKERSQIYKMAANYARSTKSYIGTTEKDLYNSNKWLFKHQIEWHRKFSLSFACLVLFFIGAPLGAIIRKGGLGMPAVVSVLFFILYYMISMTGEKFVREGVLPAYQGMWLSSVILLPLGIFLSYKAATDSVILNIDTYFKFFGTIAKHLKKNKSAVKASDS